MKHLLVALVLGVAACSSTRAPVVFEPSTTSAELEGRPAASIRLPAGELQASCLGFGDVTPPDAQLLRALFVRVVATNRGDETWTIEEAEQVVERVRGRVTLAEHASTPTGERPPAITVAPGRTASFDLMFPLLPRDADELPRFELIWTVRVGERVVSGRVPFMRRVDVSPAVFEPPLPSPQQFPPRHGPAR